jgi:hypothetical protein
MKVLGQEGFVSGQERTIFASRTDYFCVKNGLFSGQERTTSSKDGHLGFKDGPIPTQTGSVFGYV